MQDFSIIVKCVGSSEVFSIPIYSQQNSRNWFYSVSGPARLRNTIHRFRLIFTRISSTKIKLLSIPCLYIPQFATAHTYSVRILRPTSDLKKGNLVVVSLVR